MTVMLRRERTDAVDRRREHVHVDIRRRRTPPCRSCSATAVTVPRVELAQASSVSIVPMLCATIWTRPTRGRDASSRAPVRSRRATTSRFRDHKHSRTAPPSTARRTPSSRRGTDAIGKARGVERRRLERLVEAVHVDQHVAHAGGRPSRSPTSSGTSSTASMRQSPRPTEASEKRPSSGRHQLCPRDGSCVRRAPARTRASPRAPFTGLRVVAISSVGLAVSSAASKRAAVPASEEHPSSAHADAADASTRNMLRRETAALRIVILIARSTAEGPHRHCRMLG